MSGGRRAPYIRIYAGTEEISANISKFEYKYSEEEDDTCQFTIVDSYNPNLPDKPELKEGAIIKITWGYIGEKESTTRKVAIRDRKSTHNNEGVSLELLCTDVASRIKLGPKKKVHKNTSADKLAEQVADENGLKFKNEVTGDNVAGSRGEKTPTYFESDSYWKAARDETAQPRKVAFATYEEYPQANTTDSQVIRDMLEQEEGGPFVLVGRDDTLTLKGLYVSKPAIKIFTYGGSEGILISFVPETKTRTKKDEATEVSSYAFDPKTKTFIEVPVNSLNSGQTLIGGTMVNDPNAQVSYELQKLKQKVEDYNSVNPDNPITLDWAAERERLNKKYDPLGDRLFGAGSKERVLQEIQDEEDSKVSLLNDVQKKLQDDFYDGKGNPDGESDKNRLYVTPITSVEFTDFNNEAPGFFDETGNKTTAIHSTSVRLKGTAYKQKFRRHRNTVGQDPAEAFNRAANQQAKAAYETNPAEAEVEGEVNYESGQVYNFQNVSKTFSGDYYAISTVHRIIPGEGYRVMMELYRNAQPKTSTPVKAKVDATDKNVVTKPLPTNPPPKDESITPDKILAKPGPNWAPVEEGSLLQEVIKVKGDKPLITPIEDPTIITTGGN